MVIALPHYEENHELYLKEVIRYSRREQILRLKEIILRTLSKVWKEFLEIMLMR